MNSDKGSNTERYLSTGELMDMLGISRSTVYRLMGKGLPNIMVGSVHRFPRDQVLTWLEGDDEAEKAHAILQEAQEILEKVRNMQKQGETAGQKR